MSVQSCESRTEPLFENALRSALGIEDTNGNSFDVKIVSMAKKSYFQNIEFDDGIETERNSYHHFPANFTVIEPQLESDDLDCEAKSTGLSKIKVASPKVGKSPGSKAGFPLPSTILFPSEDVQLHWQSVKRVGAGLMNLGNTCFLNATLQCLTYTPPLFNYLMSRRHSTECKISGFCMTCELQKHVRKCFENGMSAVRPDSILRSLKVIARHMRWGRQEDAHEFLRYVIDAMLTSQLHGHERLDPVSKETTVVHQIFGGYLHSQIVCMKCRHKSEKFDPFLDVSIDLKNVGSVEMGLKKFIEPEMLHGKNSYRCLRCKANVEAKKWFTFHTTSNILTFQFKRYSVLGGKVTRHIAFSERLNMRPYMSDRHGDPIGYLLYAVLVHDGSSTSSGHYYCYVRAPNHVWHCINDSHVRPVGVGHVLNAQAYLLFYVREKPAQISSRVAASKEKLTTFLQNGAKNSKERTTADANLSSQIKDLSGKPHSKPSVFQSNGVLNNETVKKSPHLMTREMLTKAKHSGGNSVHENGEKTATASSSGAEGILPMITDGCSQSGFVKCNSHPRSAILTGNRLTDSSKSKHLQNGVVNNNTFLVKAVVLQNGFKDSSKRSSSDVEQQSRNRHKSCSTSTEDAVAAEKKTSEDKSSPDVALLTPEESVSVRRTSPGNRSTSGHGTTLSTASFVSDQTRRNSAEANAKCNATTKWTVVALTNPAPTPSEPVQLNATGRWTVTPISDTGCNGGTNANNMENNALSRINSKELCRDTAAVSEGSNKDGAQQKVLLHCETQRWDQSLSSRYKNIRTDSRSDPTRITPAWDGVRDRKDFLKDIAPVTLAYGTEVVTWDGEKSLLDKIMEREKKQKKRSHVEFYNAELDKGRVKKFKKAKVDAFDGVNLFEELQRKSNQERNTAKLNNFHNRVQTPMSSAFG